MGSATPVSVLFVSVFSVRDGGGYGRRQQQLLEDQWEARDSLRERVSIAILCHKRLPLYVPSMLWFFVLFRNGFSEVL